jgi:2-methylisocitrate lyase-like PEP mutase family enzyme
LNQPWDQARPRRCGHLDGKQLLPLEHYLEKLDAVLRARSSLCVVARTDASDPQMILERVQAFEAIGCDAVLADGIKDLDLIRDLRSRVSCPIVCNVIGGGKVPACSRADLARAGVQALIYSTSCLFAAQAAIEQTLEALNDDSVVLAEALACTHQLFECNAILLSNLKWEAHG